MKAFVFRIFVVLLFVSSIEVVYGSGEFDAVTVVSSVTDGDTFDTTTKGTIRLADINAPEYYQAGGDAATNYLNSTVYGKTVYLNIDDVYVYDYNGTGSRLVCVVYVEYNQTHYLNVNKAILVAGHAEIDDFENEFNPDSWSLYVSKEEIPEFSSIMFTFTLVVSTLILVVVYRKNIIN